MRSASILPQRRLSLALIALIVLLHWMALELFDGRLGAMPRLADHAGGATLVAQLLPPAPPAPPPPPEPLPLQQTPPPPLPEIAPLPLERLVVGEPGGVGNPAAVPDTAPPAPEPASTTVQPEAVAAQDAVAPEPAPPAAPPAPPPEPEMRRYAIDMPPPAEITLDVARTDADGTEWSGEALLAWQLNEDTYRIKIEAGIRVVFTRVNLVVLNSEGAVAATGFAPIKMTEKRRGRSLTATHFDWGGNRMTFSASQAAYPLMAGTQDKASVPLQLSAIARGDANQLRGDIDIFVGEDRDASVYRFQVVGPEEIDTRLGKLQTVHLTRPPKPGSYKSRLDIWLAPQHGWYPVRIRNTEANGAVTTQTVNNIVLSHSGS